MAKTNAKQAKNSTLKNSDNINIIKSLDFDPQDSLSIKRNLQDAINEICKFMSWPVGHLYLYNKKNNALLPTKIWHLENAKKFTNFKKITQNTVFRPGIGLIGQVLSQKCPIWIQNVQQDDSFIRTKHNLKIEVKGGFATPIIVNNEVFAVLEFFSDKVFKINIETLRLISCITLNLGSVIEKKFADHKLELRKKLLEKDFKKRTQELKSKEERIEACWEGSLEGLWDVNLQTNKTVYSNRWKAMLGYKPHEIGNSIEEWSSRVHPDDMPRIKKILDDHLEGKIPYRSQYRIKNKDGQWRWFQCSGQAMWDKNGQPYRLSGGAVDITEIKSIQENLKKQNEKIENLNLSKSNFIANMSHEIRTPMNGIIGMANLLLNTELNQEQQEHTNLILSSSEHLMQIINDILDISKIEAGKIELENIDFNIKKTTKEVIRLMESSAKAKHLNVKLIYPDTVPSNAIGDQGRIRQILFNLINNAIKFSEDCDIEVIFELKKQQNNRLLFQISVKDQGIGIAKDKQKTIFNKFSQADVSTTRKFGGTGLGLPICSDLIKLMDGKIAVESAENEGSNFYFTINLGVSNKTPKTHNKITKDSPKKQLTLKNINILLAEDNSINQKLMTHLLKRYGCSVTPANNGKEAVEQVHKHNFDIILMDCQMPEMDGYEATKAIRKWEDKRQRSSSIIIAVTANALKGDEEKCLAAGMDDYMSKPVNPNKLESMLMKWVTQDSKNE